MTDRLHLPQRYRRILEGLLCEHVPDAEVWAYGSRVTGESRDGSDLDLVVRGPELKPLGGGFFELLDAIELSNIPILVQAHDWARLPESFHAEIERAYVVLQPGAKMKDVAAFEGWREMRLGECSVINDLTYSPKEGWPVINYLDTGNISENRVFDIQTLTVGRDRIPSRARRKVQPGDIVYSTVRPNQRHYGLLKTVPEHFLASTGFAILRGKEGITDTGFLYWFLTQKQIVDYLHSIAENSTSAYPSIRPRDLEQLTLRLPPLAEQRQVAHVLGTLDDKIELNRRMNETLEEMARSLFKSWFVDFDPVRAKAALKRHTASGSHAHPATIPAQRGTDGEVSSGWTVERARTYLDKMDPSIAALFPNRLVESELGEIPEGWEVKLLEDELQSLASGTRPRGGAVGAGIPSIGAENVDGIGRYDYSKEKYIPTDFFNRLRSKGAVVQNGDVLLYKDGAQIGRKTYVDRGFPHSTCAVNEHVLILRLRITEAQRFLFFWLDQDWMTEEIVGLNSNSAQPGINQRGVKSLPLLFPSLEILRRFDQQTRHLTDRLFANCHQALAHSRIRDILLPKLVSGEVRIGNMAAISNAFSL